MTKNVNTFHIDIYSPGCMPCRKLLQKALIYENNLFETEYQTNLPQSISGANNMARWSEWFYLKVIFELYWHHQYFEYEPKYVNWDMAVTETNYYLD